MTRDPWWIPLAGYLLAAAGTFLFGWWLISGLSLEILKALGTVLR